MQAVVKVNDEEITPNIPPHCWSCTTFLYGPVRKCSRCKNAQYCNQWCQKADWRQHKRFCVPLNAAQEDPLPPPTNTCLNCGNEGDLQCNKCKKSYYCSSECQAEDWENHRNVCRLADDFPCDDCGKDCFFIHQTKSCCVKCGFLLCLGCLSKYKIRDDDGTPTALYKSCPSCGGFQTLHRHVGENVRKLEILIEQNPNHERCGRWLVILGTIYGEKGESFAKQKSTFLRAADKEMKWEAYGAIADLYFDKEDWPKTKKWLQKAAKWEHVYAISCLASEASLGFFANDEGKVQTENRAAPDYEASFYYSKKGANLGNPSACTMVGELYRKGVGCERDLSAYVQWIRLGAEKGNPLGMQLLGREYLRGIEGVLQIDRREGANWMQKGMIASGGRLLIHDKVVAFHNPSPGW